MTPVSLVGLPCYIQVADGFRGLHIKWDVLSTHILHKQCACNVAFLHHIGVSNFWLSIQISCFYKLVCIEEDIVFSLHYYGCVGGRVGKAQPRCLLAADMHGLALLGYFSPAFGWLLYGTEQ